MYYLYDQTGALIDEYDNLETARICRESIAETILIWYGGAIVNNDTPWELGIELYPDGVAPVPTKEFIYWGRWKRQEPWEDPETGHIFHDSIFSCVAPTLEEALEKLKGIINLQDSDPLLDYGIEERQTTIHKVKIT